MALTVQKTDSPPNLLPPASALDGTEAIHAIQGSNSKKVLVSQIATFVGASSFPEAPTDGQLYSRRGSDASWQVTTVNLSSYAPLASPIFTGDPKAPTPATADNDTSIATTAYVQANLASYAPLASPTFTGNPTAPTPTAGDNDTSIATTAFVNTKAGNYLPLAGGTLTGNLTISSAGALVVQATTASTSPTTGALTVGGGMGVNGNIYGGSGLSVAGGGISTIGPVACNNTAASSSPTTGALTVAGGLGVSQNVSVFGEINVGSGTPSNTGVIRFGTNVNQYMYFNGTLFQINGGTLAVNNTAASSSPTTGALTVAGGLGVGGNIYIGGGGFKPAGGPWSDSSDARIKTVLGDYEHGLAEVLQLAPKRYTYKGNDTNDPTTASKFPYEDSPHYSVAIAGTEYIGLIAQEVEIVMPEMVTLGTGYIDGKNKVADLRTLDTGALIYALINAVKELSARVQALEGG